MGICSERGKERDSFRNEMFNSKRYPNLIQRLVILLSIVCALTLSASAQSNTVPSTDGSFWVNLPQSFGPAGSPPTGTILAVEIPNSGVSLFAQKGEAVELDPKMYADRQKQMLYDNGAQVFGSASSKLAGHPACSFLVGGQVQGKESLFVFNQRPDAVFVFVLNYPSGQRTQAAGIWHQIAPTFKFAEKK